MPVFSGKPGTWTLQERIGQGSFGTVFRATLIARPRQGRPARTTREVVAVKVVKTSALTARGEDDLVREVGLLTRLRHENIVHLIDFEYLSGRGELHIMMEYCAVGDLAALVRAGGQ